MSGNGDWLSRVVLPDLYPRKEDPFVPLPGQGPILPGVQAPADIPSIDPIAAQLTTPGSRPQVYERGTQFALTVTSTPQAITLNRVAVDEIIIDVPSTAANSIFWGWGSGVSTASGQEVRPGIPVTVSPINTREMWELQRQLEYIASLMGRYTGVPYIGGYVAPRVIIDPTQIFVVATANTNIAVMLLFPPEQQ